MRTSFKTVASASLLLVMAGAFLASQSGWAGARPAATGGEIVARVNGDPASRDDLRRARRELELNGAAADDPGLDRSALRRVIERRLLLQEAARRGLVVEEPELGRAVSAVRRRFGDLATFGAWLRERGLDETSLFEHARAELLLARVEAAIAGDVPVADEQVRAYYDARGHELKTGGDVRLRVIAVGDEAAATGVLAALRRGERFGDLARKASLGRRASRGGDTGWLDPRRIPSPLREAVEALEPGQAGGPLRRGDEFLVVAVAGRRPERIASLAEARPEIERRLRAARRRELVRAWLDAQEKRSSIEVYAQAR